MPQPLLGSHQRSWIWGRNLLRETLRANRWRPHVLHLSHESDQQELATLAESAGIPIEWESTARLTQRCGAADHQGAIAKMPPFPYATPAELLTQANPRLIITDHLQDPFNFGAILRVADCFSATGVLIPQTRQVGVTSQVARSSAGAVNHLPIARTDHLPRDLQSLKTQGIRLVAATEHAATPLPQADLRAPLAIVIGNEGVGISPEILAHCDLAVAIPITSPVGSLNAAVAAGILMYEIARQQPNREAKK